MEHHVLHVHGADEHRTTTEIMARQGRLIMFPDTKHAVDRLTQDLLSSGVGAAALHGGKSPTRSSEANRMSIADSSSAPPPRASPRTWRW